MLDVQGMDIGNRKNPSKCIPLDIPKKIKIIKDIVVEFPRG